MSIDMGLPSHKQHELRITVTDADRPDDKFSHHVNNARYFAFINRTFQGSLLERRTPWLVHRPPRANRLGQPLRLAGADGTQRLARHIAKSKAMEMILTGQINLTAAEALTAGLASRVVAPRRATRRSTEPGRHDRRQFEYGRAHGQEAVNRVYESGLSEGLLYERRPFYSSLATADKAECSRAFIDKRQPRFTGR